MVLLWVNSINAQENFFNFVEGFRNNFSFEEDGNFTLVGLNGTGGATEHEYYFNEIDEMGTAVSMLGFEIDSVETTTFREGPEHIARVDQYNYIIAGSFGLNSGSSHFEGSLINYNSADNNFQMIHQTSDGLNTQFYSVRFVNDSTIYAACRIWTEGTIEKNVFYEFDLEGNERWHRDFSSCQFCFLTPTQILPLTNGNIAYLYHNIDFNQGAFQDRETGTLVVMDNMGEEILWEVSVGYEEGYRIWEGGMVELDGELLVSYTDPYYYDEDGEWQFNNSGTIHLDKFTLEGDIISSTSFLNEIPNGLVEIGRYQYRISQMQNLNDGNILISGTTGYGGLLLKINHDGEVIWYQEHFPHDFDANPVDGWHTHIYHTLPTSDGGFMCTGQYRSDPGELYPGGIQTAIALKVDEYGCLEEDCQVGVREIEIGSLEVYPNPSEGIFNIILPSYVKSNITVFNSTGVEVFSEKDVLVDRLEIDLSLFSSGIYLVLLETERVSYSTKIIKE